MLPFLPAPRRRWCSAARCGNRARGPLLPAAQVEHGQRLGGDGELNAGPSSPRVSIRSRGVVPITP
ncbi:CGNR zinc finger domain-containing protein [Streptomyces sp. NPDC005480]|uniref:CGNR zinc finger domain-containing protein n=1 Tax=Streptomyces sp. NPDC005480 TaxID=3154880 RepID=UPI0033A91351